MNQVAITSLDATVHDCWEDAVQHVATVTSTPRELLRFQERHDGALLFAAPFRDASAKDKQPVGWLTNRVRYQMAKSRGDLEDLPDFLSRRAREFTANPGPDPLSTLMKKAILTPKTHSRQPGKPMRKKPAARKPVVAEQFPLIADRDIPTGHPPDTGKLELLDPRLIMPSPVNPRRHFDEEAMIELTDSVRERGVRVAINVRVMPEGHWFVDPGKRDGVEGWFIFDRRRFYMRKAMYAGVATQEQNYHHLPFDLFKYFFPTQEAAKAAIPKYEIIAGERRWRAARRAGVTTIRALVETMNDQEAAELQVVENDQREDLTPVETAAGYQHLLSLPGYSMDQLVRKVGKAANTIYGRLKLLALPEPVQQAVARGELATVTAERIGRLDGEMQAKAAQAILNPKSFRDEGAKALSDREAKAAIERLQAEQNRLDLHREAEEKMTAAGYTVLKGKQAHGVISYSDRLVHNSGYVAAKDVCPHDPHLNTWEQIVEQSEQFMAETHLFVGKYAVIANSHQDGFKGVAVFARDQVNVLLKALNLWNTEGSQKSREQQEKEAAKEKAGRDREAMMRDMDAIADFARRERNPRNVLLAAVWAATCDINDNYDAMLFVARRRAWISLDDTARDVCAQVRSMATDLELDDLQALVVELAIAQMDDEESFFEDGRAEMRRLFDLEFSGEEESASARTHEPAEMEEATI